MPDLNDQKQREDWEREQSAKAERERFTFTNQTSTPEKKAEPVADIAGNVRAMDAGGAEWRLNREYIQSWCDKGVQLCNQGKYDEAIKCFNSALDNNKDSAYNYPPVLDGESVGWRGRCYLGKKDFGKAIDDLTTAISILSMDKEKNSIKYGQFMPPLPSSVPVFYYFRSMAYQQTGDNQKAIADLKMMADWGCFVKARAIEENWANPHSYSEFPITAMEALTKEGIAYTAKIPENNFWRPLKSPETSFNPLSNASMLGTSGTSTPAPAKKENGEEYLESGVAFYRLSEYEKAMANLNDAIELGVEDIGYAYYVRGRIYAEMGNQSKEDLQQMVSDFKKSADYGNEDALTTLKGLNIPYSPQKSSSSPAPQQQTSSTPVDEVPDNFTGTGKFDDGCGNIYDGQWKEGEPHGKGKIWWDNGEYYEGDFKNGSPHGKGKMTNEDGEVYEGGFAYGNFHGKGKLINADGTIDEGKWKDGEFQG